MSIRVRFAPSPTGHVHIGNIRAAIFNWLLARRANGKFLLRIEDTDLERSTPEAIATLLDALAWLQLDYDEEPLYQTSQKQVHLQAAEKLLADGCAYKASKGGTGEAVIFRIPWNLDGIPGVSSTGPAEIETHPEVPVVIGPEGISFAQLSSKGKPMPQDACLAGFHGLKAFDAAGNCQFELDPVIREVLDDGRMFELPAGIVKLAFERCQVEFTDLVKGRLAKPLDSMKDLVIVRSDGSPVFHLANVCDDITQEITHIVRGDDHVENTYRHIFLFAALGAPVPAYAHLPMIVNKQGKPYSKRDGDAFVGDFRENGLLPETLFNYLTLLGWSPGDDREKMSRDEIVQAFSLERVQRTSAQMDLRKLTNLNGKYIAELDFADFLNRSRQLLSDTPRAVNADPKYFAAVAKLMQSRTKLLTDVREWHYFFGELPEYDLGACKKHLADPNIRKALSYFRICLSQLYACTPEVIDMAVFETLAEHGLADGKLNQPLRVAITGCTVGAGVLEIAALLGLQRCGKRLDYALKLPLS